MVQVIKICLALLLFSITSSFGSEILNPIQSSTETEEPDWGYGLGDNPLTWPGVCNEGHRQSPIDINPNNYVVSNMREVSFVNYNITGNLTFTNNGHTIIVTGFEDWPEAEQPYIYGANLESTYRLVQFHLHWAQDDLDGSEHTFDYIHYPVEIHFVHLKEQYTLEEAEEHDDGISVIGVFAADIPNSAPFEQLAHYFPFIQAVDASVLMPNFNMLSLLPRDLSSFYRYSGSLTTPPCSEAVEWIIMANPISISAEQLEVLRQTAGHDGSPENHNDRPVQNDNGRVVFFRPPQTEQVASEASGASKASSPVGTATSITFFKLTTLDIFSFDPVILKKLQGLLS